MAFSDGAGPLSRPHITLIDGRSGAGKSTFAAQLGRRTGAQVLSLDEVYPGWDGLEAGEAHVLIHVLRALDAGRLPRYRNWNWADSRPGTWRELDPVRRLVVEGCGAISSAARALADHAIWIELADDDERRRRAVARDGEAFATNWQRWARQEEWHALVHRPRAVADEIMTG